MLRSAAMRALRAARTNAFVRFSSTGGQGTGKKSFFRSWTFKLGATTIAGSFCYSAIDDYMFHPPVETEIVDDLMLKKGGLVSLSIPQ